MRQAGRRRLVNAAVKASPRAGGALAEQVWAALDEQTVIVPGTGAAETVLPRLAPRKRSESLGWGDRRCAGLGPYRVPTYEDARALPVRRTRRLPDSGMEWSCREFDEIAAADGGQYS